MLQLDDGFARGRPAFRTEVQHLQRTLNGLGYPMPVDGFFGTTTEAAVKQLQKAGGSPATGAVDTDTWKLIEARLTGAHQPAAGPDNKTQVQTEAARLSGFRGDIAWIHAREGHAGKAYWPGGASGVTLDPGFDLGQQERETLTAQYASLLPAQQLQACSLCLGIQGRQAKDHLNGAASLLAIRISKTQALAIFPTVVQPYWAALCKRFPQIAQPDTPVNVQTALLSLAFNRGAFNRELAVLAAPAEQGRWQDCATLIGHMQQNHELAGIRLRRRMEAQLILDGLD